MSSTANQPAPTLTGARQTMMSWARVIDCLDDLPDTYHTDYLSLFGRSASLPYTVLAPPQTSSRAGVAIERLLIDAGEALCVLEWNGAQNSLVAFRYAGVCSLEVGNVLLYSWFTVHGETNRGSQAGLTIEFNEATLRHFEPFLRRLRPPAGAPPARGGRLPGDPSRTARALEENFKFAAFARQGLQPDEAVLQAVYQPALRDERWAGLPGWLSDWLARAAGTAGSAAHLTLLTEREIVLIGEAEHVPPKERGKYGGVRRYLPLRRLARAEVLPLPDSGGRMNLSLPGGLRVERSFDAAHCPSAGLLAGAAQDIISIST
ncbi:MAG: hypothetical protein ACKOC5_02280 [Chloroflexota bacterium]